MNNFAHTEFILEESCKSFPNITISGYYDSKTLDYQLDTSGEKHVDQEAVFEFCKGNLSLSNNKKSIDLEFSHRNSVLFQYTGGSKWVILGGKNVLNHRVKAFLNELWIVKKGLEQIENGQELEASDESLEKDRNVFNRFPKVWGKKDFTVKEDEDLLDSLQRSAHKLRRKQYIKLHNELKAANFEKMYANYFLSSNINLEKAKNFFSYRKFGNTHYFFLAKSNHPDLDTMVHYSSLSTYINNIDDSKPVDREKTYKELKDIVRNFVIDFDENSTNDDNDNVAIFTIDDETKTFGFSMQGYYVTNISSPNEKYKTLIFNDQNNFHSGDIPFKNDKKHVIFSEELLDLFDGDIKKLEDKFIEFAQNPELTKDFMDNELEKIQKEKKLAVRPDFLLFYSEIN